MCAYHKEHHFRQHDCCPVIQHPTLIAFRKDDRTSDGYPQDITRLNFFDRELIFIDHTYDRIYYYLLENLSKTNENDAIVLVVGTDHTGDRVRMVSQGKRRKFFQDEVLYNRYFIWQLINPADDAVAIASTSNFGAVNHLNMEYGEGDGYMSPIRTVITITPAGLLLLIPEWLIRDHPHAFPSASTEEKIPPLLTE
ncbi:hypothetical protein KKB64_01810 [Patescibacteria group bacterium]|nr:hypothetical protein [Patescibacteria group bacterium]MBU1472507.1 hypothetical protein [Patescibacteria group bacterium]MBU2460120.1 hypothetical protein [Patescibacteria group bacterium]MBU2544689.1 hypothetical protein [Patescibacteria group bacterium]